jgi:hypothetical protein
MINEAFIKWMKRERGHKFEPTSEIDVDKLFNYVYNLEYPRIDYPDITPVVTITWDGIQCLERLPLPTPPTFLFEQSSDPADGLG